MAHLHVSVKLLVSRQAIKKAPFHLGWNFLKNWFVLDSNPVFYACAVSSPKTLGRHKTSACVRWTERPSSIAPVERELPSRMASTCVYVIRTLHFQWSMAHIDGGKCDLSTKMAEATEHIRFISDLLLHRIEAWNRRENIWIPAQTFMGHIWSVPQGRKTSELGHLNQIKVAFATETDPYSGSGWNWDEI